MNDNNAQAVVHQFIEAINARDIEGLAALMTDDRTFTDAADQSVVGKAAALDAWRVYADTAENRQSLGIEWEPQIHPQPPTPLHFIEREDT